MWEVTFIYLLAVTFCSCQLNGKFWWTDSNVANFHKVKIPEPVIEDISLFDTDESAKIVFRDESLIEHKPAYKKKKFLPSANIDICHYVRKDECRGVIYSTKYGKSVNRGPRDPQLVCCLEAPPQPSKESSKIYFPGFRQNNNIKHRSKRSGKMNPKRPEKLYITENNDYDEDPYWNIKNSNLNKPQTNQKVDDSEHDSIEELPKPGLVGIYSDYGNKPDWSFQDQASPYSGFEYDDVDDTPSFGYGFIDPRRDSKDTKRKTKPLKTKTPTDEPPYDPRNLIISFQSNPDFKVLEGFKLLNLAKSSIKQSEETNDNQSKETLINYKPDDSKSFSSEESYSDENNKIYNDCGKSIQILEDDKESEEATAGSHPWLALVVHTKRRSSLLCYATLIHPRAAITVASCVDNRTSPGELILIAGIQYLNRRSQATNRIPKVIVHPDYRRGDLANNLALLIWQTPLKLSASIQPACLADFISGDDCMLFGWGGFGSGFRTRSRWQRGRIRSCNTRKSSVKSQHLPQNSFCVSVEPQTPTVTGLGGPLICEVNGRNAVVGVLLSRQLSHVLLPVRDWAMHATIAINEHN